jgi:hypothetical protein
MKARRIFVFAGSLWDLARFFLVIVVLAALFDAAGGWRALIVPWLLIAASAGLPLCIGGFMIALFPQRYARLVVLLRLAKIFNLFSLLLLLFSGILPATAHLAILRFGKLALTQAAVLPAMIFLDLLFFAFLISFRGDGD